MKKLSFIASAICLVAGAIGSAPSAAFEPVPVECEIVNRATVGDSDPIKVIFDNRAHIAALEVCRSGYWDDTFETKIDHVFAITGPFVRKNTKVFKHRILVGLTPQATFPQEFYAGVPLFNKTRFACRNGVTCGDLLTNEYITFNNSNISNAIFFLEKWNEADFGQSTFRSLGDRERNNKLTHLMDKIKNFNINWVSSGRNLSKNHSYTVEADYQGRSYSLGLEVVEGRMLLKSFSRLIPWKYE